MQYNTCKTCGAKDGRAGNLYDGECDNCYKTRTTGEVYINVSLRRTEAEIEKTMAILDEKTPLLDGGLEVEAEKRTLEALAMQVAKEISYEWMIGNYDADRYFIQVSEKTIAQRVLPFLKKAREL